MSVVTRISNLKVRTKMLSGFGCVVAILAGLGGVSLYSLRQISDAEDLISRYTKVVNIENDIEIDLTRARLLLREYLIMLNPEAIRSAEELLTKLPKSLDELSLALVKKDRLAVVGEVAEQLKLYRQRFNELLALVRSIETERVEVLDRAGARIRSGLQQLAAKAAESGDTRLQIMALAAMEPAMAVRLDANKALTRHDDEMTRAALARSAELAAALKPVEALAQDPALKPLIESVNAGVAAYDAAFHKLAQATVDVYRTLNVDMRGLGARMTTLIDGLQDSAAVGQQDAQKNIDSVIALSDTLTIGMLVGGLAIGVGLALLIGGAIGKSVGGMTEAMRRLADGDTSVDIPGVGKTDEIGMMAGAMQVFKENRVIADRLAGEQAAERAAREKRAERVESLTFSFEAKVGELVNMVSTAAAELRSTAESMTGTAGQTTEQATTVAVAAEQASANVQNVAGSAEELSSSISEISRQVTQSARIAGQAVNDAKRTDSVVRALADGAQKIGDVVSLISDIAGQTNLLALNATIEAARAGEAGRGFAVVASEVKSLATQTAKATEDIARQINGIQEATKEAVGSIQAISTTIGEINEIAAAIAAAVEEQGAATQEIARSVQQAAAGTQQVTANIGGVSHGATVTGAAASQVLGAADELSRQAESLNGEVREFMTGVKAA